MLSVVQGIQCCGPAAIPPPPLPTTVRIPVPTNGCRHLVRRPAQQGQEQRHERPEQGGQDAPPLGELLEGQQPEQGENAGDRHTKQTFIESLGEPIDAQQNNTTNQIRPCLFLEGNLGFSRTHGFGNDSAGRHAPGGALLGPKCWPTRAGLRGNVASKSQPFGSARQHPPGLRGGRGEKKSVTERTRKETGGLPAPKDSPLPRLRGRGPAADAAERPTK